MTAHNGWRRIGRVVAGGAIACTLIAGTGAPVAWSAPADDQTTDTDAPAAPQMTADEALAIIQKEYDTGAAGGQISNLIHQITVLRNAGFRPSKANQEAIIAALDKRPNQAPLVAALKATVAYQSRIQAQMIAQQEQQGGDNGFAIGGAPAPFNQGGVILGGPG